MPVDPVIVGRITTVHGVKGWVKVHSFTEPTENIFQYSPWWLKTTSGWQIVEVDQARALAKGHAVHIVDVDDREQARQYCKLEISVEKSLMPSLEQDEYYWHQLQGLRVITRYEGGHSCLGKVTKLIETGSNDVLMVKGDNQSIDREERLVPYLDQFVLKVDLDAGEIEVDWDPDF